MLSDFSVINGLDHKRKQSRQSDALLLKKIIHLVLESHDTRAPGADSEEKHEPVSEIDTVVVDSRKRLTLNGRLEKRTFRQRPFYEFAP